MSDFRCSLDPLLRGFCLQWIAMLPILPDLLLLGELSAELVGYTSSLSVASSSPLLAEVKLSESVNKLSSDIYEYGALFALCRSCGTKLSIEKTGAVYLPLDEPPELFLLVCSCELSEPLLDGTLELGSMLSSDVWLDNFIICGVLSTSIVSHSDIITCRGFSISISLSARHTYTSPIKIFLKLDPGSLATIMASFFSD